MLNFGASKPSVKGDPGPRVPLDLHLELPATCSPLGKSGFSWTYGFLVVHNFFGTRDIFKRKC